VFAIIHINSIVAPLDTDSIYPPVPAILVILEYIKYCPAFCAIFHPPLLSISLNESPTALVAGRVATS
jgi:hypothetical protein